MGRNSDMFKSVTAAIIWNIWLERNRKIFSNIAYSMDHCIYCITNNILLWITVFGNLGTTSHDIPPRYTITDAPRPLQGVATRGAGSGEAFVMLGMRKSRVSGYPPPVFVVAAAGCIRHSYICSLY